MSIVTTTTKRRVREPFDAGDLIGGKYRLSRKVGAGAMGSVWIATNVVLESKVAIKLLHPDLRSPVVVERFLREARSAAMLNHPAIIRIFDLGATADGDPFIVMELLAGESLRACLDRLGALAPERAVELILPIAAAIHVAHEHGIVHRDLKPDNIMIADAYGGAVQLKVVDFGIAKLKWGDAASSTGANVIGTPDYMSPEQARGLPVVDHRADIWSLSALLYEALAGRAPFTRDRIVATLLAVTDDEAPSLAGRGAVDAALWAIIERGLRKDPAERWPSMRAFGEALAAWLWSRGVREDACGVSLRAQWLSAAHFASDRAAPPGPSAPLGTKGALPPDPRARARHREALRARFGRHDAIVALVLLAGAAVAVTALAGSLIGPAASPSTEATPGATPEPQARAAAPGHPAPADQSSPRVDPARGSDAGTPHLDAVLVRPTAAQNAVIE
jgi:eukaryotic-like serine/threonine-protein kinase